MDSILILLLLIALIALIVVMYNSTNSQFNLPGYLGRWYEVARIPQPFEIGLTDVTAEYTLQDGKLQIENCGYLSSSGQQTCAKAVGSLTSQPGVFDVSFFPGQSSKYIILALSPIINGQYQWAVVGSENKDALWLLSRSRDFPNAVEFLKSIGSQRGYSAEQLNRIELTKHTS